MILTNTMDLLTLGLILIPILIIIFVAIPLIIYKKKKKKTLKPSLNEEFELLVNSFGSISNITNITKTQDRISLSLKDKKLVSADVLKEFNISATFKGQELTILYRKDSEGLYHYIKELIK